MSKHLINLLTVPELAEATGWKEATIRQKVWRREIDYVKLGRSVRFTEETLRRLIERGTMPARQTPSAGGTKKARRVAPSDSLKEVVKLGW